MFVHRQVLYELGFYKESEKDLKFDTEKTIAGYDLFKFLFFACFIYFLHGTKFNG